MAFAYQRSERIASLLHQELSRIIVHVKGLEFSGFVTLTDLEVSRDLKSAKVYYSILGTESERKQAAQVLENAKHFMRRELKARLSLKYIPFLTFVYDPTPEKATRIFGILEQIEKEKRSHA